MTVDSGSNSKTPKTLELSKTPNKTNIMGGVIKVVWILFEIKAKSNIQIIFSKICRNAKDPGFESTPFLKRA